MRVSNNEGLLPPEAMSRLATASSAMVPFDIEHGTTESTPAPPSSSSLAASPTLVLDAAASWSENPVHARAPSSRSSTRGSTTNQRSSGSFQHAASGASRTKKRCIGTIGGVVVCSPDSLGCCGEGGKTTAATCILFLRSAFCYCTQTHVLRLSVHAMAVRSPSHLRFLRAYVGIQPHSYAHTPLQPPLSPPRSRVLHTYLRHTVIRWLVDKIDFRDQSIHLAFKAFRQESMYQTTRGARGSDAVGEASLVALWHDKLTMIKEAATHHHLRSHPGAAHLRCCRTAACPAARLNRHICSTPVSTKLSIVSNNPRRSGSHTAPPAPPSTPQVGSRGTA